MSRECRKCGEKIPFKLKIEDKEFNLQNRKFCLKCSPFGNRNTSPNDPIIRVARKWKDYSKEQKTANMIASYYRALKIRRELFQKSGGKCQKCGYSKCKRALTFHHRNANEKLFGLTLNNLWSKKRELINKEAEKCDILCMNCHIEIEDMKSRAKEANIVERVNKIYGENF
jgi:hypothetical protein